MIAVSSPLASGTPPAEGGGSAGRTVFGVVVVGGT